MCPLLSLWNILQATFISSSLGTKLSLFAWQLLWLSFLCPWGDTGQNDSSFLSLSLSHTRTHTHALTHAHTHPHTHTHTHTTTHIHIQPHTHNTHTHLSPSFSFFFRNLATFPRIWWKIIHHLSRDCVQPHLHHPISFSSSSSFHLLSIFLLPYFSFCVIKALSWVLSGRLINEEKAKCSYKQKCFQSIAGLYCVEWIYGFFQSWATVDQVLWKP